MSLAEAPPGDGCSELGSSGAALLGGNVSSLGSSLWGNLLGTDSSSRGEGESKLSATGWEESELLLFLTLPGGACNGLFFNLRRA